MDGKVVLVTGGTGSFGKVFVRRILKEKVKKVIVFSRDELKQFEMKQEFQDKRLRYFIGDVRDVDRLKQAFIDVDIVVHAAAMKQVESCEYNPFEAIKTNINGAQNIIDAAIERDVKKVIALSTDKACSPINLYGATKLASDKLFLAAKSYVGNNKETKFSVVRYGNVVGSRGSVVPFFKKMSKNGVLPITDIRMTRFWITLPQAVEFVLRTLNQMQGAELFVPKIPSMKIIDLAKVINEDAEIKVIGIRPGEKLHEIMITKDDSRNTLEYKDLYVITDDYKVFNHHLDSGGMRVNEDFEYNSNQNNHSISKESMEEIILNEHY